MRSTPSKPGRPQGRSGLPPALPNQPFSLIGTLRRTRTTLTVKDAADLLLCSEQTIYQRIKRGTIPVVDFGAGLLRIDPKAWADLLEHDNSHLLPSAKAALREAA